MKVVELQTPKQGLDVELLAKLHHYEFGGGRDFHAEAVGHACVQCVLDKQRNQVNCWIAYNDDNEPIGYIAGTIHRSFYSYRSYAIQQMWFVVPAYRGTRAAIKLLKCFEAWARRKDVERIYTQVEHDNNPLLVRRTLALMQRLGYNSRGYIAVKVVDRDNNEHEGEYNDRSTHREVGAVERQA